MPKQTLAKSDFYNVYLDRQLVGKAGRCDKDPEKCLKVIWSSCKNLRKKLENNEIIGIKVNDKNNSYYLESENFV